ncbi:MAG: aminoacyl-tRNA hydrolase [Patescibacteria group bacterium]
MNGVFNPEKIKLIVGLGNPGSDYENTYHNAGFLALKYLSENAPETDWRQAKKFSYIKTSRFILVKPEEFMNESGNAVKEALKYFKSKKFELLLVHDDSDLESGKWKLSFGRGAAGHRGVESIIASVKSPDFWRARIGVRNRKGKAGDFVLKKISSADRKSLILAFRELKDVLSVNG